MAKVEIVRANQEERFHGLPVDNELQRPEMFQAYPENGSYKLVFESNDQKEYLMQEFDIADLKFSAVKPNEFFTDNPASWVKLDPIRTIFHTENAIDALRVAILKGRPDVGYSRDYIDKPIPSNIKYLIHSEEAELEAKASKIETRKQAMQKALKMTAQDKLNIVLIMRGEDLRKSDANAVEVKLFDLVDNDPDGFIRYADLKKEELNMQALVKSLLDKDVLVQSTEGIKWGDTPIGYSIGEAANNLLKTEHQNMKLRLQDLDKA